MTDRAAARAVPPRSTTPRAATSRAATSRAAAPRSRATAPRTGSSRATPRRPEPVVAAQPAVPQRGVPASPPAAGGSRRRTRTRPANRRAPFVLLVVALLLATTLGLLILNTAIAVDSLKATQLQADNAERAQEVQRLERRVVSGGSPAQIASAAVAAGLVPAAPAAYLVIAPDGTVTLRGTPAPAPDPADETTDED